MKSGLFKKILTPENEAAATKKEAPPDNPFTTSTPGGQLPAPKRAVAGPASRDPFEEDDDFGYEATADGPEPAPAPKTAPEPGSKPADPASFAVPQEKQMTQPTPEPTPEYPQDSEPIRQLELRAIFGVDQDMSAEEILDRGRKLKGIRKVIRMADADSGTIDALKAIISRLGFGNEPIRIHAGSTPINFIREGRVALAVQTDGAFAPGVRETLILVARELSKM